MLFGVFENPHESFWTVLVSAATTSVPWAFLLFRRDNRIDLKLVVEEQGKYIKVLKHDIKELRRSERRCQKELGEVKDFLRNKFGVKFPPHDEDKGRDTDDAMPTTPKEDSDD